VARITRQRLERIARRYCRRVYGDGHCSLRRTSTQGSNYEHWVMYRTDELGDELWQQGEVLGRSAEEACEYMWRNRNKRR